MTAQQPQKKRHHYVPVGYLKRFVADDGFLYAYRKDQPDRPIRTRPEGIGFQTFYYSQPTPEGTQDNNRLEGGLSALESDWPALAERLAAGANVNNHDDLSYLLAFIALQRVRVPAARDVTEFALAESVMRQVRALDAAGQLPPKPAGFENILDLTQITIDPHQSIHGMPENLKGMAPVLDAMGYEVLHNRTGLSVITSDNPVCYFDPRQREAQLLPYRIDKCSPVVELLFPVDPWTVVRGHTMLLDRFARKGMKHVQIKDSEYIRRINRHVARFAYETIIASDLTHGSLVRRYAVASPVPAAVEQADGAELRLELVFGPRRVKPKWQKPSSP